MPFSFSFSFFLSCFIQVAFPLCLLLILRSVWAKERSFVSSMLAARASCAAAAARVLGQPSECDRDLSSSSFRKLTALPGWCGMMCFSARVKGCDCMCWEKRKTSMSMQTDDTRPLLFLVCFWRFNLCPQTRHRLLPLPLSPFIFSNRSSFNQSSRPSLTISHEMKMIVLVYAPFMGLFCNYKDSCLYDFFIGTSPNQPSDTRRQAIDAIRDKFPAFSLAVMQRNGTKRW